MAAGAQHIIRAGLRSAREQIENWRNRLLDDRRLRDGTLRLNSAIVADLAPWEWVLARLGAAEQALAIKPPVPSRHTIRRGLQAAMALAEEYRLAITNGYGDPEDEPEKRVAECRYYVRPVDRAIERIRAALDATAMMAPAPGVSKELRDLIAAVDRARVEHEAASDAYDAAWSEMNRRCPAPAFSGPVALEMAEAMAGDEKLSEAERSEIRAYAERRAEIEAELGMAVLDEVSAATAHAWTAAEAAALLFPARSLADVLEKLCYGLKVDYFGESASEPLKVIADDLARLTGR